MITVGRFLINGEERCAIIEDDKAHIVKGGIFDEMERTGEAFQLSELAILPPLKPNKIIGIYSNYRSSVLAAGQPIPKEPPMFFKANSAAIGHGQSIVIPKVVKEVAFEAELAFVIKKKARNIKKEDAGYYILGYTGANDLTAKNFMSDGPWAKAKCFDTFQPLGRYLVITDDFNDIPVMFKLNGKVVQHSTTADFIFTPMEIVEYLSSMMTLEAGDVILTGTPAGGGPLNAADVSEVIVGCAGNLINNVVRDM